MLRKNLVPKGLISLTLSISLLKYFEGIFEVVNQTLCYGNVCRSQFTALTAVCIWSAAVRRHSKQVDFYYLYIWLWALTFSCLRSNVAFAYGWVAPFWDDWSDETPRHIQMIWMFISIYAINFSISHLPIDHGIVVALLRNCSENKSLLHNLNGF